MKSQNDSSTNLAKVLWYYDLIHSKEQIPGSFKMLCPFHEDINPSMLVDIKDGSWFCFGCQEGGDAYKFLKKVERANGLNDLQTILLYNKVLSGLEKTSGIYVEPNKIKRKKFDNELYDQAYDYYYGLRKVDWRDYSQLLDEEYNVLKYMKARGFTEYALTMANARATFNKHYPIIFPMIDNGMFKGWVCRTTTKEIEAKRKYLYNEGFSRATTLVGSYGSEEHVFVVEGYMDRLKLIQYGEENVVAILGWKATLDQVEKLKESGIKTIISALDNDKYGKQGTDYLKKFFNVVRFSYLKGVKDPGDMTMEQFDKSHCRTMAKLNS